MKQKTYSLPVSFILRDRYEIIKLLGQGGFGITYLANDTILDQNVCIKELFVSGSSTRGENQTVQSQSMGEFTFDDFKTRFIGEAKQLSKFNHPNIVKVTDIFEANNTAYFVMEYAEGDTLKEHIQQNGALNVQQALPIMKKLLSAVEEVHHKGMLHRDIKPDNIILKPNKEIVLIDFGSARAFGEGKTITQTALLTPGYAPLEQYSVKAKRGVFSDIYALGATMYFLLTGEKPLAATDRVTENMPAPHELNSLITSQVSSAIMLAMEIKTEDRFQNIEDFRNALIDVSTIKSKQTAEKKETTRTTVETVVEKQKKELNKKSFSNFFGSLFGIGAWWIRIALVSQILVFSIISYHNPYDDIWYSFIVLPFIIYLIISLVINWKRTLKILGILIGLSIVLNIIGNV